MRIKIWIICFLVCVGVTVIPFSSAFASNNLSEKEYCDKAEKLLNEGKFEEARKE